MQMRTLLNANTTDLALVIGNGINRYKAPLGTNSWEGLLTELARRYIDPLHTGIPKGVSPTEFYDVLELSVDKSCISPPLQTQFCQQMATWTPLSQHFRITNWAHSRSVPILTTNFESTLGAASNSELRRCRKDRFTAFYPWGSYFAPSDLEDPLAGFAIWHVNGMQMYRQSVRLGLSHYMGSVGRVREWLHTSGSRLFGAQNIRSWPGANTWLQIFLHKSLLFFGLQLGENEVFLRWLLIERAKYFREFPMRAKKGWYAYVKDSPDFDAGKELFLRGVGIEPVAVPAHSSLYGAATWK